ncbi:MAG: TldD/PmbA family protein [Alphaproteobacteria bacterium]
MTNKNLEILNEIVKNALKKGADQAEAICYDAKGSSISCRMGKIEENEAYETSAIGIRVFSNKKQVSLSSSGNSAEIADKLLNRALDMVKLVPDDPFCGLASKEELFNQTEIDLELYDDFEPDGKLLSQTALETENIALNNPKIVNSEGAGIGYSKSSIEIAASNGFSSSYQRSGSFISLSVIAGNDKDKEREYDSHSSVFFSDLDSPETIANNAVTRAIELLDAQKIKTCEMPVIFESRVATSLLSHFASAISGVRIARGASFLKDFMNQKIFNSEVNIIDNPLIKKGRKSSIFDAEGLPCQKVNMVENGLLKNWFLDLASARQLNLPPLGQAAIRLGASPCPSPSNLYIANGSISLNDIAQDYKEIFLITSLSGQGVNLTNGDYSRGAKGFILQNGQKAYPVNEVTISGNLIDIFKNITPLNDLDFRYSFNSPSLFINKMTIAGK